MRASTASTP
ncbi:hypothetical protein D043_3181A, partial [Vibrio parahaemolyticus EKP-021]